MLCCHPYNHLELRPVARHTDIFLTAIFQVNLD